MNRFVTRLLGRIKKDNVREGAYKPCFEGGKYGDYTARKAWFPVFDRYITLRGYEIPGKYGHHTAEHSWFPVFKYEYSGRYGDWTAAYAEYPIFFGGRFGNHTAESAHTVTIIGDDLDRFPWFGDETAAHAEDVLGFFGRYGAKTAAFAKNVTMMGGKFGDRPLYKARNVKAHLKRVDGRVESIESGFIILDEGDYRYIADGNEALEVYVTDPSKVSIKAGADLEDQIKNVFYIDREVLGKILVEEISERDIWVRGESYVLDALRYSNPRMLQSLHDELSMAMDYLICRVDEEAVPLEEVLQKKKQ